MFDYIEGALVESDPVNQEIVVATGGIGFRINVSKRMLDNLPSKGEDVRVYVEFVPSEHDFRLYGFFNGVERTFFRLICSNVRNVGPSTAINIMSAGSVGEMKGAIVRSEHGFFSAIKGIGRKTAERIIRELRDRMTELSIETGEEAGTDSGGPAGSTFDDALKALVELGLSTKEASDRIRSVVRDSEEELPVENIIKKALSL